MYVVRASLFDVLPEPKRVVEKGFLTIYVFEKSHNKYHIQRSETFRQSCPENIYKLSFRC